MVFSVTSSLKCNNVQDNVPIHNNIYLNHLHITKSTCTQGKITNNNTKWNMIQSKGK